MLSCLVLAACMWVHEIPPARQAQRLPNDNGLVCCRLTAALVRRQHACIACGGMGEFALRGRVKSHMMHLMCKRWVVAAKPAGPFLVAPAGGSMPGSE